MTKRKSSPNAIFTHRLDDRRVIQKLARYLAMEASSLRVCTSAKGQNTKHRAVIHGALMRLGSGRPASGWGSRMYLTPTADNSPYYTTGKQRGGAIAL